MPTVCFLTMGNTLRRLPPGSTDWHPGSLSAAADRTSPRAKALTLGAAGVASRLVGPAQPATDAPRQRPQTDPKTKAGLRQPPQFGT
jgi:hypothetical protein